MKYSKGLMGMKILVLKWAERQLFKSHEHINIDIKSFIVNDAIILAPPSAGTCYQLGKSTAAAEAAEEEEEEEEVDDGSKSRYFLQKSRFM